MIQSSVLPPGRYLLSEVMAMSPETVQRFTEELEREIEILKKNIEEKEQILNSIRRWTVNGHKEQKKTQTVVIVSNRLAGKTQKEAVEIVLRDVIAAGKESMHYAEITEKIIEGGYAGGNQTVEELKGSVAAVLSKEKEVFKSLGNGFWTLVEIKVSSGNGAK